MLDELHVRNIALIEDASIAFSPSLTVLTGETGAGKTALLAALDLICGKRADSLVVSDGADEALAEARFVEGGEEHVLKRRLSSSGRSRCTVDGSMATVGELAQAASSIRVHGQHEQVLLLEPATQLAYLDSWISPEGEHLQPYRAARQRYLAARERFDELDSSNAQAAQELEFMRFTEGQISKVDPKQGEYEELEAELPRLQHGEQLAQAVNGALACLHDDGASIDLLARAVEELERQGGVDEELDAIAERLSGLLSELDDATRELSSYAEGVVCDPQRLEDVLARLDELSGLMRRYGPGMEQVFATWKRAKAAIARADASPEQLEAARGELASAERAYRAAGKELAGLRHEAGERFCESLAASVHELAMEGAAFEFSFSELPLERWTEAGSERVELLYRPAPSSSARPLSRIASGGELSRILLSLECLYQGRTPSDASRTIVFDEVDQGVGGATGNAVAERLASLSQSAQVVVVTHLPQVAARAERHYVVSKERGSDGSVTTSVEEVEGASRVREVARMLAGTSDEAALEHARTLLASAGDERP